MIPSKTNCIHNLPKFFTNLSIAHCLPWLSFDLKAFLHIHIPKKLCISTGRWYTDWSSHSQRPATTFAIAATPISPFCPSASLSLQPPRITGKKATDLMSSWVHVAAPEINAIEQSRYKRDDLADFDEGHFAMTVGLLKQTKRSMLVDCFISNLEWLRGIC